MHRVATVTDTVDDDGKKAPQSGAFFVTVLRTGAAERRAVQGQGRPSSAQKSACRFFTKLPI